MIHYMAEVENSLKKFVENVYEAYREYGVDIRGKLDLNMIDARNRIDRFFDEGFDKVSNGYTIEALTRSLSDRLEYLDLYETEMKRINMIKDLHDFVGYEIAQEFSSNFNRFKQEVCEIFSKTLEEKSKRENDLQITSSMSEKEKAELIKSISDERARMEALDLLEDEEMIADILQGIQDDSIRYEGIMKIKSAEIRDDLSIDLNIEFSREQHHQLGLTQDFIYVYMDEKLGEDDEVKRGTLQQIKSERLKARLIASMLSPEMKLELIKEIKGDRNRDRIMDSIDEEYKKSLQDEIAEQREHIEDQEKEIKELQIIQQRDSRGQYQPGD